MSMEDALNLVLAHGLYAGVTLTLIVCGLGLPIPEEAVFLAAGYYGQEHGANVWVLCVCGVVGIVLGDSIPYWVGRKYGLKVIGKRPFKWFMSQKGIERTRGFFGVHGSKAVFCGRFIAGLRMPTFFMAGSMGVSYTGFVVWDLLGALISCPISIYLAHRYGKAAEAMLKESKPFLFGAIALIVGYAIYHIWSHKEKPDASKTVSPEPASPEPAPTDVA